MALTAVSTLGCFAADGVVSGSITDTNNAFITKAAITLQNVVTKESRAVKTDDYGMYNISLTPGIYEVTARRTGFCPQTRAPFEVKADSKLSINLRLYVCGIGLVISIDSKDKRNSGSYDALIYPYKEEKIMIGSSSDAGSLAIIRYGVKHPGKESTVYDAIVEENDSKPAVWLSYNTLQVSADSMTQSSTNVFSAVGNVILEDGQIAREFKEIQFSLNEGNYTILASKTK